MGTEAQAQGAREQRVRGLHRRRAGFGQAFGSETGKPVPGLRTRSPLYARAPSPVVHLRAHLPATAKVYECERLRCGARGEVFTVALPADVAPCKYDRSVGVQIGR